MNKPLKFSSKTHKLLWCADFHMGHRPTWSPAPYESRGFKTIDEHDSWIRDQWFKLVDADTIVFNLGDIVFSDPKGEMMRQITSWPGKQLLLNGNHLSGMKQIYQETMAQYNLSPIQSVYPTSYNNTTFVGESLAAWIDGNYVHMTHYAPYIWPEMGHGGWSLCGHSHSSCPELNVDNAKLGKILDVGLDNAIKFNGTPFFTWDEIKRILNKKEKVVKDHHNGSVAGQ
jgi:calcineurin-like phosphoesterase family protein